MKERDKRNNPKGRRDEVKGKSKRKINGKQR
jgi:hypothetical protein